MGYIVYVRVETGTVHMARALAIEIIDTVHALQPEIDAVSTQVSEEGRQNDRHFVFCGERLDGDIRCLRPYRHCGEHSPDWPTT
jgi:hypothetical protein